MFACSRIDDTFTAPTRAHYALGALGPYLSGRVLDVGAGGSASIFKEALGRFYFSVDLTAVRATPDVFADFERSPLPFADSAFDAVLCFDVLEHVDDPFGLFAECARVSRRYMIIALPNNWPGFFWSFVRGHNVSHLSGYGLPQDAPAPGHRHKWFFNIEEGEAFLKRQADKAGFTIRQIRHVYEPGADALVYWYPYPVILSMDTGAVRRKRPHLVIPFLIAKYGIAKPFSYVEEVFKRAIWGWGRYRYANMFCRQLWAVLEKRPPLSTLAGSATASIAWK